MKHKPYRHYSAPLFMMAISFLGWATPAFALFNLPVIEEPFELLFLLAFIFICEYFPMPFRKGNSSLTFPVVYLTYLIYGIELVVLLYFLGVLLTTLLNKRPIRIIFFNPAQLVLSLTLAHLLRTWVTPLLDVSETAAIALSFLLFLGSFYLINNLIVDFVLLLRPEKYTLPIWLEKGRGELLSFSISLVYGFLLHFLGNQNRGDVDIFSYFFFLSPLIFLAIISSIIIRLRADKQRLKALFHFSSELNKVIPVKEWEEDIKRLISAVVSYEESFLFTRDEKGKWQLAISEGTLDLNPHQFQEFEALNQVTTLKVFNKEDLHQAPLAPYFSKTIQALVYAPLVLDNDQVGCLIMAKMRTNSFIVEDVHSIATIANQLAIFLKTQMLFSEKEQRLLLEERNRIAHDIHDGIAQILAGVIMKYDTAAKKIFSHPKDAQWLINDNNKILRAGLKEIRDSIYALRPYPTEQLGLHLAIKRKIAEVKQNGDVGINISFESQGHQSKLNLLVEKVVFSIIQESIQNCIKHAKASNLTILLRYAEDHVFLKVKDDGIGFSLYQAMTTAMKEPHYGILQMNEDADKVNATLQIESSEKEGTEIMVKIPLVGSKGGIRV
ncbi:sensor histidine kinase [Planococcus sp. N028]|uniref:histidine kinase n=1 Tax=Planococcus shixiaomingii TaxID=3058393 RepID=A0ABT8N5B4_9BACL|nr:sensor histidine kinase [Planococcus sp. N028]MDN7243069.1 sensor histidine kinase [Planococcus sp. N028]